MGSSKDPRYSLAYTAVPVWIGMFRIDLSGDPHTDHCRDMCFAQRISKMVIVTDDKRWHLQQ